MAATAPALYTRSTQTVSSVNPSSGAAGAVALLGRFFFVLIFLMSGPRHFMSQTIAYAAAQGVPLASIAVPLSGVLALLGDSVTTDHISPAGSIKADSPAGRYLSEHGVARRDFNSYGSRRGNHEVMIRGTFANIRLRNLLLAGENNGAGVAGGYTRNFLIGGGQSTIYDAAMAYAEARVPLVVLAGTEYGSGSSRDWAAKGTALLGVKAVIAQSFERIHRSNLIGMGVLPLQFPEGCSAAGLELDGTETYDITGITGLNDGLPRAVHVVAHRVSGEDVGFDVVVRIDTPGEADYYRHGGIMRFVLRDLLPSRSSSP